MDSDKNKALQQKLASLFDLFEKKRLTEAEKLAKEMTRELPAHPVAWEIMGAIYQLTGRINESLRAFEMVTKLKPNEPRAHDNLGVTLKRLRRYSEAAVSYEKSIHLDPNYPNAHYNLANTLRELGRFDQAIESYKKAISLREDYVEAHNNLAILLERLGRFDEAESVLLRLIKLKPEYSYAHINLGNTLKYLGRFKEAIESYEKAIDCGSDDVPQAITNIGVTLQEMGRLPDAEASFVKAIELDSSCVEAHLNYINLLEISNRLEEMCAQLDEAAGRFDERATDFLFYKALAEFRIGHSSTASAQIRLSNAEQIAESRRPSFFKLRGDLYDQEGNYESAFREYNLSNLAVKSSMRYSRLSEAADEYFSRYQQRCSELKSYKRIFREWTKDNEDTVALSPPVFLVGFPRSGTTLMDTILRTHSKIEVMEELPLVEQMHAVLGDPWSMSAIEGLTPSMISSARDFYLRSRKQSISNHDKLICIDKLPLNIFHTPLITKIFPEAKFILALRHPVDCIFSCWMQNFKLNVAMCNMVDLERTVELYCLAMELFKTCEESQSLNVVKYRYEDLVLDLEGEVTRILDFLGVEWENELAHYRSTALARPLIDTPSHGQVIKPLYCDATMRWKKYEKQLQIYIPRLQNWIDHLGY